MSRSNACEELVCVTDAMPDVARQPLAAPQGTLNWVGMSEIALPIFIADEQDQRIQTLAKVQAYVNMIDPSNKGIHMSRLYLTLNELLSTDNLNPAMLRSVVERFVDSQNGISSAAFLECRFDYFEKRRSLKTENTGWKNYPTKVTATLQGDQYETELCIEIPYSSTCPASAALARQLVQEGFREKFGTESVDAEAVYQWLGTTAGISATPHSQRSVAQIKLKLADKVRGLPITRFIDRVENALKTPVQAAVKREDEQEFARLNAANLMFCEDAARRVKQALAEDISVRDFWIRVNHLESLHAHDAVAVVVKGVEGGYQDDPGQFISS